MYALVKAYDKDFHAKEASKVVDANGKQLMVYHGTANKFTEFDYGRIGTASGAEILGDGFYFADNSKLANAFVVLDEMNRKTSLFYWNKKRSRCLSTTGRAPIARWVA